MRSNAAASCPSSSSPVSAMGSSKWPSAIRLAARSSLRMRRACIAATTLPSTSAIPTAANVATRKRRSTSRTVASWSPSDAESSTTPDDGSSGTATSAYSAPPRRTRRRHGLARSRGLERRRALRDRIRPSSNESASRVERHGWAERRRTRPRATLKPAGRRRRCVCRLSARTRPSTVNAIDTVAASFCSWSSRALTSARSSVGMTRRYATA